jgi:hypothetical protein
MYSLAMECVLCYRMYSLTIECVLLLCYPWFVFSEYTIRVREVVPARVQEAVGECCSPVACEQHTCILIGQSKKLLQARHSGEQNAQYTYVRARAHTHTRQNLYKYAHKRYDLCISHTLTQNLRKACKEGKCIFSKICPANQYAQGDACLSVCIWHLYLV